MDTGFRPAPPQAEPEAGGRFIGSEALAAIAIPAAEPTCSNCPAMRKIRNPQGQMLQCRFDPPKLLMVPVMSPMQQQAMSIQSFYPAVSADEVCLRHPVLQAAYLASITPADAG